MTTTIQLPKSREEVRDRLSVASQLATGSQWEIAATCWALLKGGISTNQVKSWGIVGLKSSNAITSRSTAWQKAIDSGLVSEVALGDLVTLPEADYFDYAPAAGGANNLDNVDNLDDYAKQAAAAGTTAGMAVRAGRNLAALTAAIKADPKVAEAAGAAIRARQQEGFDSLVEAGREEQAKTGVDPLWTPPERKRSELEVTADVAIRRSAPSPTRRWPSATCWSRPRTSWPPW